ncbi:MAG TPA: hypothetical protein VIX87_02715 [Steroidobacteraceae bacterium]
MSSAAPMPARATPPMPAPGSAPYFALLYAPHRLRAALARLLGLADEIGVGAARGLDHAVAHARLEWWRYEAAQYALGQAQHPWLRAADAGDEARLDLLALVEAAALDLAYGLQRPPGGEAMRRTLFVLAAQMMVAAPLSPQQSADIAALGALTWQLERALPPTGAAAPALPLHSILERLGTALQPQLVPLLVWAVIDVRRAARARMSYRTALGARIAALRHDFADNLCAWSAARRAATGTFSSP